MFLVIGAVEAVETDNDVKSFERAHEIIAQNEFNSDQQKIIGRIKPLMRVIQSWSNLEVEGFQNRMHKLRNNRINYYNDDQVISRSLKI